MKVLTKTSEFWIKCWSTRSHLYLSILQGSPVESKKQYLYFVTTYLFSRSNTFGHALVGTWTRDLSLTKGVLYRWATRAILKWAGLDHPLLPAAQWIWSVQDKFKWPICCCQIISRECCNYSLIHFLVFRNSNLSVIDRNLNFLNLPVHFCKKAQLGLDEGILF